jgi:hypothetical protein
VSLKGRLDRLEAAVGLSRREDAADARRHRVMDRLYFEQNNARRELDGRALLPTPPELEDTREDILDTLSVTLPFYRERGDWTHGEGKELLDAWQDRCLEKLAELEKGDAK